MTKELAILEESKVYKSEDNRTETETEMAQKEQNNTTNVQQKDTQIWCDDSTQQSVLGAAF